MTLNDLKHFLSNFICGGSILERAEAVFDALEHDSGDIYRILAGGEDCISETSRIIHCGNQGMTAVAHGHRLV